MFTSCRSPGTFAKARYNASRDPPNHNGKDAKTSLFSDSSSGRRDIHKMLELDTVENSMADTNVREVHAGDRASGC